ncbi:MAG: serine--tRNA ligase [Planctomycetota bacterium]
MIDLKDLRQNPDRYRRGVARKQMDVDLDALIALDADRREAQRTFETLRAEQNAASKAIGKASKEERPALIAEVGKMKDAVHGAEAQAKKLDAEVHALLLTVPQPADDDVPDGVGEADNVVVREEGEPRVFDFEPKDHITLCHDLGLADFEAGVKLAGSRSYFLKGAGALLHDAVLRLAFDMMVGEHGFTPVSVPVIVREDALIGTGFLPAHREAVYHAAEDDLFLVGTGEVGLTGLHMNEVLREEDLPLKYTTVSTCFRREAGTYGKDTAGLYRVHQFDKCEQVVICKADEEESRRWHQHMLGFSEELLHRLDIPYRVIQCCTGDLGPKNADMLDLEAYMPSRPTKWGETHSASRLYDFQSRRLNLRYKTADGETKFCHTLNNTVVASPRILIPILENHQQPDGNVEVPAALRPYMHGLEVIRANV